MSTASDKDVEQQQQQQEYEYEGEGVVKIFTGADSFGCSLKQSLVQHLIRPNVEVVDLGVGPYYSVASSVGRHVSTSPAARGLLFCGTGVGVTMIANKHPGVFAALCSSVDDAVNARSINNCNVLSLSGMSTSVEDAVKILEAWLRTPFKAPCPASGNAPWPRDVEEFLDRSMAEMRTIPIPIPIPSLDRCSICWLRRDMEFEAVSIMPGGEMKIVRESPTSAIVKFKGGSVEPAHHHTFGHDVMVRKGRKRVWNLDKGESWELGEGDYLYTPAGDVHRVMYLQDTEFFISWDGDWDIFLDEDLEKARAEIDHAFNSLPLN